jgi:hypothetical protein
MILLVSGEGPTDIGATQSQQCPTPTDEVAWGPMGMMINKLVEPIWGYEPINGGGMMFVAKAALLTYQRQAKAAKPRSLTLLGRGDRKQETAYFFENARSLARIAKEVAESEQCQTGGVLFRDADGTRSADRSQRDAKVRSMQSGFAAESFPNGVPMVPKPKSEAWLLCALQEHPYQECDRFEALSGNDDSPNPAKDLLDEAIGSQSNAGDLAEFVAKGRVDVQQIEMPSFREFRERMEEVAKTMLSGPENPGQIRP